MQCIFLFKDAQGRLPTARELSRRGFVVSRAVLTTEGPAEESAAAPEKGAEQAAGGPAPLAWAAESPARYGACGEREAGASVTSGPNEAAEQGGA